MMRVVDIGFDDVFMVVSVSDGRRIQVALKKVPKLLAATMSERYHFSISPKAVHWPSIGLDVAVLDILRGDLSPNMDWRESPIPSFNEHLPPKNNTVIGRVLDQYALGNKLFVLVSRDDVLGLADVHLYSAGLIAMLDSIELSLEDKFAGYEKVKRLLINELPENVVSNLLAKGGVVGVGSFKDVFGLADPKLKPIQRGYLWSVLDLRD